MTKQFIVGSKVSHPVSGTIKSINTKTGVATVTVGKQVVCVAVSLLRGPTDARKLAAAKKRLANLQAKQKRLKTERAALAVSIRQLSKKVDAIDMAFCAVQEIESALCDEFSRPVIKKAILDVVSKKDRAVIEKLAALAKPVADVSRGFDILDLAARQAFDQAEAKAVNLDDQLEEIEFSLADLRSEIKSA